LLAQGLSSEDLIPRARLQHAIEEFHKTTAMDSIRYEDSSFEADHALKNLEKAGRRRLPWSTRGPQESESDPCPPGKLKKRDPHHYRR
jgi:hypothetical protein